MKRTLKIILWRQCLNIQINLLRRSNCRKGCFRFCVLFASKSVNKRSYGAAHLISAGKASGPYFASRLSSKIISAVICFTWVLSVSYELLAEAIQAVIRRLLLSSRPQVARHPECPRLDESAAMLSATARRQRCQRAKAQRSCRIMQEVTCLISRSGRLAT